MSQRPFKFVHAGDFHLEIPGDGSADVPESLADLLVDCPYRAAQQVFDTVLAEEADLLILSGNLLDVDLTGPRGMIFLIRTVRALATSAAFDVYWAAGEVDAAETSQRIVSAFPDNVRIFSSLAAGRNHRLARRI